MRKIFSLGEGFNVPDGTFIHSIIDPRVTNQEDVSFTFGRIPAGITSKIHVHPVIKQLTWIVSGKLTIKMKDSISDAPYTLELAKNQMALTEAGTFFQMSNKSNEECSVIYVNVPGFVFEMGSDGSVLYNDAIVFDQNWEELPKTDWNVEQLKEEREKSLMRLRAGRR